MWLSNYCPLKENAFHWKKIEPEDYYKFIPQKNLLALKKITHKLKARNIENDIFFSVLEGFWYEFSIIYVKAKYIEKNCNDCLVTPIYVV